MLIGSLRAQSTSAGIAAALRRMQPPSLAFEPLDISLLSLYNLDLEADAPQAWRDFRGGVLAADGVVFISPECHRSIPAVLKDAVDVGSRPFGKSAWRRKPAAVITHSPGAFDGFGANHRLRQSLVCLDVATMPAPEACLNPSVKLLADDGAFAVPETIALADRSSMAWRAGSDVFMQAKVWKILILIEFVNIVWSSLSVMTRQASPASTSAPATSRITVVSDAIRADILDVRVAPGSRLHMAQLAERFDVSPSLIREALSRLVADGWVKAIDQRGFRVCPVSIEDLQDITRTRIDVESIALRRSIETGDSAWEGRVLGSYHELSRATPQRVEALKDSMLAWSVLHRRFHGALVSACGSEWLLRFRDTLTDQSERYRKLSVSYATEARNVDDEHRQIMQAALDRDAESCLALMTTHFQHTANVVLASAESALRGGGAVDGA